MATGNASSALCDEVCAFIREKVPNRWGLFRTEPFDAEKMVWTSDICDPDDLGDFAPFMAWHDIATGQDADIGWVGGQLQRMNALLRQGSGLYHPFSSGSARASQSPMSPAYPQNHLDFTLGCNILHMMLGGKEFLDASASVCGFIAKHAISRNGFVYGSLLPALNAHYPKRGYLRHKAVVSGVFMEEFSNLFTINGDEALLTAAKRMASAWASTPTFRRHGICCDQVTPMINSEAGGICSLGKMNTNFACGLIRLYEVSHDESLRDMIEKNLEGLMLFGNGDGSFFSQLRIRDCQPVKSEAVQAQNHMVMGSLLDAYEALKAPAYLNAAEDCMGFWLQNHLENGLFPMNVTKLPGWEIGNMDTHSDMVTIASRLYMLTRKRIYKEAIRRSVDAYILFRNNGILFRDINVTDGSRVGRQGELKYLGGLLKGLMSSQTALHGHTDGAGRIKPMTLRLLMRDR